MKKILFSALLVTFVSTTAFAGGVFQNSQLSAEYFRTFTRNAATNNADAAYYNMGGTVKMKDGIHVNFSNYSLFQKATVDTKDNPLVDDSYVSDNAFYTVPNLYVVYKKDNWAAFTSIQTIGATSVRKWENGLPTLDALGMQAAGYGGAVSQAIAGDAYSAFLVANSGDTAGATAAAAAAGLSTEHFSSKSNLEGSSYYLSWNLGGAYAISNNLSFGASGRIVYSKTDAIGYVEASNNYSTYARDVKGVVDITEEALGYSGMINVNYSPIKNLLITLTYELATKLEFETEVHDGKDGVAKDSSGSPYSSALYLDGKKSRLDLPHTIRLGVAYNITKDLRTEFNINAYLENYANFNALNNEATGADYEKDYTNTYETSIAVEYIINSSFLVSTGINMNFIGQKEDSTTDISAPGAHSNYISIAGGFQYKPIENLKLNLGLTHTRFVNKYTTTDQADQTLKDSFAAAGSTINPTKEYDKKYWIVALGAEYSFF